MYVRAGDAVGLVLSLYDLQSKWCCPWPLCFVGFAAKLGLRYFPAGTSEPVLDHPLDCTCGLGVRI